MLPAQLATSVAPTFLRTFLIIILPVSLGLSFLAIALMSRSFGSRGTAVTRLAMLKSLVGAEQALAARSLTIPARLSGPVDLVGSSLAAAMLTNPVIAQVLPMIGAVQLARAAGGRDAPRQFLSDRLAGGWGDPLKLPRGFFKITELHARPMVSGPAGDRMLVWFAARIGQGAPFTEYWTFVSTTALPSLPAACPNCGAPTTGSASDVCAYCHVTLRQPPAPTPEAPAFWMVDDISTTRPAVAA